jgi:transcriptional regulator of heat shock response
MSAILVTDVVPGATQVSIGKNDNMKRKISEILSHLTLGHTILISTKSVALSKAVSIIEISKQQFLLQLLHDKVHQFNKIVKVDEPVKSNSDDDLALAVSREIKGKTCTEVPVMYVLLSSTPIEADLATWTNQTLKSK